MTLTKRFTFKKHDDSFVGTVACGETGTSNEIADQAAGNTRLNTRARDQRCSCDHTLVRKVTSMAAQLNEVVAKIGRLITLVSPAEAAKVVEDFLPKPAETVQGLRGLDSRLKLDVQLRWQLAYQTPNRGVTQEVIESTLVDCLKSAPCWAGGQRSTKGKAVDAEILLLDPEQGIVNAIKDLFLTAICSFAGTTSEKIWKNG
ncbi:hypothetical protein CAPTEDRAFT_185309 [Capitella teleta]|uniref:Uncharacterized protein n=1 Tax=Capitella teleta TaxID=283909 RepID=R7TFV0_CAPTE|nr:hypothetical protein CAPTEDRAFT_185309 [Capitella teleta]|eukprot:ELT89921.1 hypothetical protein CAPTEDRAFT_185309 [Capitella teleta]